MSAEFQIGDKVTVFDAEDLRDGFRRVDSIFMVKPNGTLITKISGSYLPNGQSAAPRCQWRLRAVTPNDQKEFDRSRLARKMEALEWSTVSLTHLQRIDAILTGTIPPVPSPISIKEEIDRR